MTNTLRTIGRDFYLKGRQVAIFPFLFLRQQWQLPKHKIRSILFLRHDRIGDMVLSTAAIKALRRTFPKARLTILASERNNAVLEHNPYVDEILIYRGLRRFIKEVRPRHYDLVVDPFLTHELKQALMSCLAGGKYRIGFEVAGREAFFNLRGPKPSRPQRMVDHLLDLVEHAGADTEGCVPQVYVSEEEAGWAKKVLELDRHSSKRFIVALHPGAYYPSQRWAAERFGELAMRILQQGRAEVILLGSSDEKGLLEAVKKNAGLYTPIFSCENIREFIALLSKCDLLVCNNSGPLHIAAALQIPTVSTIGPTVTPLWLPYGKENAVINKSPSCSPCSKAMCKDHQCLSSITVDEVLEAVKTQIEVLGAKHRMPSTPHRRDREPKKSWKAKRK